MEWIVFSLIGMVLIAIINIIDKHLINTEIRDPSLATLLYSGTAGILFTGVMSFLVKPTISTSALIGIGAGIAYTIGFWTYFKNMEKNEVSRFTPLFGLIPLFLLTYELIIFKEAPEIQSIIGLAAIVIGSFIISLKTKNIKHWLTLGLLGLISTPFLLSIRNFLIKMSTTGISPWEVLFWMGIGKITISIIIYLIHRKHIHDTSKKGIEHIMMAGFLEATALFMVTLAISKGTASLVSGILQGQHIIIFLTAIIISIWFPKYLKEEINKKIILQKAISISLIILGVLLITL